MDTCRRLPSPLITVVGVFVLYTRVNCQDVDVKGGEYCEFETFQAKCPHDHVIVMKSALYGRMELGKCVVADLGYVGCSADVLDLADQKCSGKRQCQISMPDKSFTVRQKCLAELKSYFKASYTCQKVISIEERKCRRCDFVRVTNSEGYIASVLTKESGCGSPDCPWLIQVQPGQRVNLTLVNFGWSKDGVSERIARGETNGCQVFGTIKEDTVTRGKTVCKGPAREQHVYTSMTNSVELRIVGIDGGEDTTDFLFKYQAVGCADVSPPQSGWMRRMGDMVTMGCNHTSATWKLTCSGSSWEGERRDCGGVTASASLGRVSFGKISMPYYVSIAIVVLVAVVVGALILTIGLIIVKRHYSNRRRREAPYSIPKDLVPAYKDSMYMSPQTNTYPPPKPGDTSTLPPYEKHPTMEQNDNSYTHIWERPLPDPRIDPGGSCTCPSSPYGTQTRPGVPRYDYNTLSHLDTGTGQGHVGPHVGAHVGNGNPGTLKREFYGNNTMARREIEPESGSDDDPRYYSLDPDGGAQR